MSHRTRLVLELTGDEAEPIAGYLGREGHAERPFTGWLELMALVHAELELDRPSPVADAEPGWETER